VWGEPSGGSRIVDSGYTNVTPLHIAIDAGATHLLVVEVEPLANTASFQGGDFWSVLKRLAIAVVKLNLREDLHSVQRGNRKGKRPVQLFRLYPAANRVGMLDFDGRWERGRVVYSLSRLVEEGRKDAMLGFLWDSG